MANNLQERIDRIRLAVAMTAERYAALREAKKHSDAQIVELQRIIDRQNKEIEQLKVRIEHLTVVTTLSPTRESAARTRAMLSELVQEIDKCIADLKD